MNYTKKQLAKSKRIFKKYKEKRKLYQNKDLSLLAMEKKFLVRKFEDKQMNQEQLREEMEVLHFIKMSLYFGSVPFDFMPTPQDS